MCRSDGQNQFNVTSIAGGRANRQGRPDERSAFAHADEAQAMLCIMRGIKRVLEDKSLAIIVDGYVQALRQV